MRNLLLEGRLGLGFHGSAQVIDRFEDRRVGSGADANSSLGLFMSHVPLNALEYALNACELGEGSKPLVYVVAFPTAGKVRAFSPDEYYGIGADGEPFASGHFASLRRDLIDSGFDQVACDTGEDAVTVALSPSQCRIIAILSPEVVERIDSRGVECLDPVPLYDYLSNENLLASPTPFHRYEVSL